MEFEFRVLDKMEMLMAFVIFFALFHSEFRIYIVLRKIRSIRNSTEVYVYWGGNCRYGVCWQWVNCTGIFSAFDDQARFGQVTETVSNRLVVCIHRFFLAGMVALRKRSWSLRNALPKLSSLSSGNIFCKFREEPVSCWSSNIWTSSLRRGYLNFRLILCASNVFAFSR